MAGGEEVELLSLGFTAHLENESDGPALPTDTAAAVRLQRDNLAAAVRSRPSSQVNLPRPRYRELFYADLISYLLFCHFVTHSFTKSTHT